ncbi:MAG: methylmalonyl Co-A mutase-associated GTPase MeaB [Alphaproteobacteria bacterium]|nr:methylmalonyl Co-A mutase-associated GTPase MeaB [Rhodospirillales bacterium]MCW9045133.1 methylmalonyl Co-A mutase-associated GTPase MeaB [Alphaproteobacteria bacterium]
MSLNIQQTAQDVLSGQRRALARAITLIESTRADHRDSADILLEEILPHTGGSIRLGITGVPGVGKSTFIEAFGLHLIKQGLKVAVLAVDPSSPRTGGSILGDKTRMEELSRNKQAFIRPSPSGGTLGGVARRTREAMLICEAAGFDVIIIETVGVGQSETAVADMVDMFLLLLVPGAGDELQGIKKGIVELADMVIVNKADGDLAPAAERARHEYTNALHLLRPVSTSWTPPVKKCSAKDHAGIDEIWNLVGEYREKLTLSGEFNTRRAEQAKAWMWNEVGDVLMSRLKNHQGVIDQLDKLENSVKNGKITPTKAAMSMLATFTKSNI